jgi:hypothetical protein
VISLADQCKNIRCKLHFDDADWSDISPIYELKRDALIDSESSLSSNCKTGAVLIEGAIKHLVLAS